MKVSIGGIRCGKCSGMLNQSQVNLRLVQEIHEANDEIFGLIGALQVAGLDKCNRCKQWSKDTLVIGDNCMCAKCLSFDPEDIISEDYEGDMDEPYGKIVRFLSGKGLRIKWPESMLPIYKRMSL